MNHAVLGRLLGALIVLLSLAALVPQAADAGTYAVYSCRTPTGMAAPTDGWERLPLLATAVRDECGNEPRAGSLVVDLHRPEQPPNLRAGSEAGFRYAAPEGTTFARLTYWRTMLVTHNGYERPEKAWGGWLGAGTPEWADGLDRCGYGCTREVVTHPAAIEAANRFTTTAVAGERELFVAGGCVGANPNDVCSGDGSLNGDGSILRGGAVEVHVQGVAAELEDASAPSASGVGGSLTDAGPVAGVRDLRFAAADTGSGLYRTAVELQPAGGEYAVAQRQVVDDNGGRCAQLDTGPATDYEFAWRVPCRLAAQETVAFDSRSVADGTYELRVVVEDAAGNRTVVYERQVAIDNVPSPVATEPPSIAGTAAVGQTLRGLRGQWIGSGLRFTQEWLRCDPAAAETCATIPGATREGYTVTKDDAGKVLRLRVTATSAEGEGTALSAPTATVGAPGSGATTPSGSFDDPITPGSPGGTGPGGGASAGSPAAPGAINGVNASGRARLETSGPTRRRLAFRRPGRTRITLRDENGRPITGAAIVVLQRMAVPGAEFVAAHPAIRTDDDGRVNYLIEPGFSRTLRFAYSPTAGGPPAAIRDLAISVPSRTTLRTSRRFLRNGQSVRFRGRLRSGPVPGGGVGIDLQARVGRRWQTFRSLRTRSDGRWRARYRFRATRGLQTYSFRARVRSDSSYPYAPSRSRRVKVRVRG